MKFFLGIHQPIWLTRVHDVPLLVSHRRLGHRRTLPRAVTEWALDSGGFTELQLHGRWQINEKDYVRAVRRYADEIGNLVWAAPQDWMCEQNILKRTGLTVREHQRRTVRFTDWPACVRDLRSGDFWRLRVAVYRSPKFCQVRQSSVSGGSLRSRLIIGELRVQPLVHGDGRKSFTIVWPDGEVHQEADGFLRLHNGSGTQKTYAYFLVDHLRWRERECLDGNAVTLLDLHRYMGAVGARVPMPYGVPWRAKPYSRSALSVTAACLKGFYCHWGSLGVNEALAAELTVRALPTKADRDRALLGHTMASVPVNPLAPKQGTRRPHPKMLPDGARPRLERVVNTARDRMVVTWLADAGPRIGELVGLHLVDLHLREDAECGECRAAHFHVCHRQGNANGAAAKTKTDWEIRDGLVTGGLIKRASPAMISTYFEYMTTEYPTATAHGMLLVQLSGANFGQPWTADAARGMLRRAGRRAGLTARPRPHSFRHNFATGLLDASAGNAKVAQVAGGWASARTVEEIYGHPDLHNPEFQAALAAVWKENER